MLPAGCFRYEEPHWLGQGCEAGAAGKAWTIAEDSWGFSTHLLEGPDLFKAAATDRGGYLRALCDSRSFHSPNCVQAMAESYGVGALLSSLQVTSQITSSTGLLWMTAQVQLSAVRARAAIYPYVRQD